jgi:uncharacterized protein (DUF427 family)
VRDYPRPPGVVPSRSRVRVELSGETLADTGRALRGEMDVAAMLALEAAIETTAVVGGRPLGRGA